MATRYAGGHCSDTARAPCRAARSRKYSTKTTERMMHITMYERLPGIERGGTPGQMAEEAMRENGLREMEEKAPCVARILLSA